MNLAKTLLSAAVLASALGVAHAGIIEDLLAKPAIQALLGRQPEIQSVVQKCTEPKHRQRNLASCQQADDASRLAKMPPELRAVMASPAASASIRELCLGVQTTTARNSYLCTELAKADLGFAALIKDRKEADAAKDQENMMQERQLGR